MKLNSTNFIIAYMILALFFISLNVAHLLGAVEQKKKSICVGPSELLTIKEDRKFFDDVYKLQQDEVKGLREKLENKSNELTTCHNQNYQLKSTIPTPENKFNKKGKQII